MSPDLKHCPFCGEKGEIIRDRQPWESTMWAAACPAGHVTSPEFDTKEQAAKWWNTRPRPKRKPQP